MFTSFGCKAGNECRHVLTFVLATFLALTLLACSSCGSASFPEAIEKNLDEMTSKVMEKYKIPGMVVLVCVPGEGTWVKAKGESDIKTGQPMKPDDKFRIGSNTKTFTTTLILQLVDDGLLSLDDNLEKYISGVPNGDRITIRQLCNNTSGLFEYGEDNDLVNTLAAEPRKKWTPRELVDVAISHEPYFPPGEGYHYSNTNFILQGMIIEKITGNTLADEYQARIFDELSLDNTSFPDTPEMTGDYSHGYGYEQEGDEELGEFTEYLDPSIHWAAGAIISNLDDLKVWAKALAEGELISDAMQKERLTWIDLPGEEGLTRYGLGIFYLGGLIGHNGQTPGYECSVFYLPKKDATIIVLLNSVAEQSADLQLTMAIAEEVFPDEVSW